MDLSISYWNLFGLFNKYIWYYSNISAATNGLVPCPTDVNGDGTTNNADFLQLLGEFNQSCN